MRLLYSRSASPHHGFAAYYTYVEKIWGADAVLHFGTHGSLEFMPGKQMGMSETCYPDSLIGSLPNLYSSTAFSKLLIRTYKLTQFFKAFIKSCIFRWRSQITNS